MFNTVRLTRSTRQPLDPLTPSAPAPAPSYQRRAAHRASASAGGRGRGRQVAVAVAIIVSESEIGMNVSNVDFSHLLVLLIASDDTYMVTYGHDIARLFNADRLDDEIMAT